MNYLIWKDINSKDIKGLIISELPPITKPRMRVQETEVDGVDGSIIEELGYESYDKPVRISLSYNYDIDKVIKYFSGEGNVIFSNEPDKCYKARILDQIDYERLLRFRTATVIFRVQPFKYEYLEDNVGFALNDAGGTNFFKADEPANANNVELTYTDRILTLKSTDTSTRYSAIYNFDTDLGDVIRFSAILLDRNCHIRLQEYTPEYQQIAFVSVLYTDGVTPSLIEYRKKDKNNLVRLILYTDYEIPTGERIARYKDCILTINNEDMTFREYDDVVETVENVTLENKGNYTSKPVMVVKGTGIVEISINGSSMFAYEFPEEDDKVIIDSQKQDAYLGSILKNRNMSGEFPILEIGENVVTWNGNVTSIKVNQKSRWL